ncbi:hypothetical protein E2562_028320 [Oryza meyeriana var. granulata]|uniref:Uncharacterized protein n=1 Tax=Oryza meyeriana var. granulata TaxID=110450 RepID=A0A6G1FCV8_9ORYZ|nr:hypothetical protein E2562_028320 [Oryza meyeriana var. granulata]
MGEENTVALMEREMSQRRSVEGAVTVSAPGYSALEPPSPDPPAAAPFKDPVTGFDRRRPARGRLAGFVRRRSA